MTEAGRACRRDDRDRDDDHDPRGGGQLRADSEADRQAEQTRGARAGIKRGVGSDRHEAGEQRVRERRRRLERHDRQRRHGHACERRRRPGRPEPPSDAEHGDPEGDRRGPLDERRAGRPAQRQPDGGQDPRQRG